MRRRRRGRTVRNRVLVAAGAVLALCVAGGGVAVAMTRTAGATYRTAVAGPGSVRQVVDAVGTVEAVRQYDAAFAVSGTVATVEVAVGDTVEAGATLATLDPSALQDAVESAESALEDAQETLAEDVASQTSDDSDTSSSSTTSATAAASSSSASSTPSSPASTQQAPYVSQPAQAPDQPVPAGSGNAVDQAVAAVRAAQRQLLDLHGEASAALATSRSDLAAATTACALLDGSDDPTATPDPTATLDPDELETCRSALAQVAVDQEAVDTAQSALADAMTALDDAVATAQSALDAAAQDAAEQLSAAQAATAQAAAAQQAASSSGASSNGSGTAAGSASAAATTSGSSSGQQSGGLAGSASSAATTVASAADLVADQAAIDVAESDLAIAQQALTRATLTSPIAGTVADVAVAVGDSASAGTTAVTVLGEDGYLVTTTVALSDVDLVQVGQAATVTLQSTDAELGGTVTSVGVLDVSSSADPEYTVLVGLEEGDAPLYVGSSASVSIEVGVSEEVLTVPTSAVHRDGTAASVQVLRDGQPADVTVETGAVGSELTEVTSGLSDGDVVVLADLSQAIVSDTETSTSTGLSGLGGAGSSGGFGSGGSSGGFGPPGGFSGQPGGRS